MNWETCETLFSLTKHRDFADFYYIAQHMLEKLNISKEQSKAIWEYREKIKKYGEELCGERETVLLDLPQIDFRDKLTDRLKTKMYTKNKYRCINKEKTLFCGINYTFSHFKI